MSLRKEKSARDQEIDDLQIMRLSKVPGGQAGKLVGYSAYEIYFLTPFSNALAGAKESTKCVVSLSGGLASAEAAMRAIRRYGRENVVLWYSDVLIESPGLYRFLHAFMQVVGGRLYWFTDGRTPFEVAEQRRIIPNSQMAPCSFSLKIAPYRQFIRAMATLPVVVIGLGPDEKKRLASTRASYYEAFGSSIQVEFPLCWTPAIPCEDAAKTLQRICQEEWKIPLSPAYQNGFNHDNCNGLCVRAGIEHCTRNWLVNPAGAEWKSQWEQRMRQTYPGLAKYAFNKRQTNGTTVALTQEEIRDQYYLDERGKLQRREDLSSHQAVYSEREK